MNMMVTSWIMTEWEITEDFHVKQVIIYVTLNCIISLLITICLIVEYLLYLYSI